MIQGPIQSPIVEPQPPQRRYSRGRLATAWAIAIAADALQIGGVAFFTVAWPLNEGLDIVVALILTLLIGWHIAFIPTFLLKSLPIADLAPTWSLALLIATRGKGPAKHIVGTPSAKQHV